MKVFHLNFFLKDPVSLYSPIGDLVEGNEWIQSIPSSPHVYLLLVHGMNSHFLSDGSQFGTILNCLGI